MSANDGGPPIRVSREPVDRPRIPRGRTFVPIAIFDVPPKPGDIITFPWARRDGFTLTFHDVEVQGMRDSDLIIDIGPEVVVTWDPA